MMERSSSPRLRLRPPAAGHTRPSTRPPSGRTSSDCQTALPTDPLRDLVFYFLCSLGRIRTKLRRASQRWALSGLST
jgi:hypothetical protein